RGVETVGLVEARRLRRGAVEVDPPELALGAVVVAGARVVTTGARAGKVGETAADVAVVHDLALVDDAGVVREERRPDVGAGSVEVEALVASRARLGVEDAEVRGLVRRVVPVH